MPEYYAWDGDLFAAGLHGYILQVGPPTGAVVANASAPISSESYTVGDTFYIDLNFSRPVEVTGTPIMELETGMYNHYASYDGGSGTWTLTFAYTVNGAITPQTWIIPEQMPCIQWRHDSRWIPSRWHYDHCIHRARKDRFQTNADIAIDTHLYWDPAAISRNGGLGYEFGGYLLALGQPDGAA